MSSYSEQEDAFNAVVITKPLIKQTQKPTQKQEPKVEINQSVQLQKLRNTAGITRASLGKMVSLSERDIAECEKGAIKFNPQIWKKITEAFNLIEQNKKCEM